MPIIYLYIKQHSVTGLKYFGRTIKPNPFKYHGSGIYWSNHIKKYGKQFVKTLEVWGFDDQELCTEFALKFSEENNIVESKDWANKIPEDGLFQGGFPKGIYHPQYGKTTSDYQKLRAKEVNSSRPRSKSEIIKSSMARSGRKRTIEQRANIAAARVNQVRKPHTEETKRKMSLSAMGRTFNHTEEAKRKISLAQIGRVYDENFRKKVSKAKKGIKPRQAQCPHCPKSGSITTMKRWHFDNCKSL